MNVSPRKLWTSWRVTVGLGVLATVTVTWAATRGSSRETRAIAATAGAPDIGNVPPRERFARLADRVQGSLQSGDTATVARIFPRVEAAYASLSPTDRDIDARFHIGILQAQVGHAANASAQADSVLAQVPRHLLGLYLKAIVSDYQGYVAAARAARADFRANFNREVATLRPEYQAHRNLLDQFLKTTPPK